MLPLELALAPPDRGNAGGSKTSGPGWRHSPEVPVGAREKAFLCVTEAVRASGSRFVEGYGVKPTIHVMIRLVFTLSECSPANGGVLAGSSSGSAVPGAVCNGTGGVRGSGLTAGTDALRLSCLKCLEVRVEGLLWCWRAVSPPPCYSSVLSSHQGCSFPFALLRVAIGGGSKWAVLRAPFACEWHHSSSSSSSSSSSNDSRWSEVRNDLKDAMGGGILAQLVQELLLCCQQGEESSPPAANGAGASRRAVAASPGSGGGGRSRVWGGAEEARAAAGCLEALCSFTPGSSVWRRLLPGTFSGLFRTIRGIDSGRDVAGGMVLPSSVAQRGGDGRRRGSGSKSALAEVCLGTLAKVLLMCAGGDAAAVAAATRAATAGTCAARDPARVVKAGEGIDAAVQGGTGGEPETSNSTSSNPLLALQRLAVTSNASARNPGNLAQPAGTASAAASPEGHHRSDNLSPTPPCQPGAFAAAATSTTTSSAAAASAAAASATVIAVENPEWEARTSDRLRLLLPPLLAFCCLHPGWRVRRATAKLASDLLRAGGDGNEAASGGEAGRGSGEGKMGLLEPLTPLLMEALVGLLLDSMPQVSAEARRGLDSFRATLSPFRWLELRGILLERLSTIVEGLPAMAKSADEKRLRGAFDLLAGYLSLLRFDARTALDGRLSLVLSCLCETLEFDEDFNVQVFANVREDSTLSSARRAVRLLGKFCDLPSLADASISSLETRPPRPPPPPSGRRRHRPSPVPSPAPAATPEIAVAIGPWSDRSSAFREDGGISSSNDTIYRRRCLKWLRLRLPLAWVLNQALLGRGSGSAAGEGAAKDGGGEAAEAGKSNVTGEDEGIFLRRGLAISMLERLLASHAFNVPVSRAEAAAAGYSGSYGNDSAADFERESLLTSGAAGEGENGGVAALSRRPVEYTRSGQVLGAGGDGGTRSPSRGVSGQVLDANATLVSTIVEALGSLAEASGPGCGEAFLRRALYPLLEKAASTHPVVSQSALATLARVRVACGDFEDTSQLLEANMDYVVDDVVRRVSSSSRRSRNVDVGSTMITHGGRGGTSAGSGIPGVVEAVLRIGGSAMGPALVRDLAGVTLREVDACAWDPRQTRCSLGVLRAVASCVTLPPLPAPGVDEKDTDGKEEGDSQGATERNGNSALVESPWFRQLFVEFADASDILRAEENSSGAGDRAQSATSGLVKAVKEHREAMGYDVPDDDSEEGRVESDTANPEYEKTKAKWREIEEEARKAAGQAEEESEGQQELPEPDAEGRKMAESEEVKTLSEVLARSCHFLATPSLETQALALACMRDCVLKLASAGADAALLPHVHRAWRPLMASLREHLTPLPSSVGSGGDHGDGHFEASPLSSRRAVVLHSLDTVDALVDVCGDFLSSKVSEDLWPLLKLLLLQYAAFKTPGGANSSSATTTITTTKRKQQRSTLFTSSSPPSQSISAPGELFLVGSKTSGRTNDTGNGIHVDGDGSGLNSLLAVPPGGPVGGVHGGGGTNGPMTGSVASSGKGGRRGRDTMGEKVVARTLESLERLCSSQQCERFMTPLAREVAIAALPCLSSAGATSILSRAEALFRRLAFLDGDGVWLLLMQTMDTATQQRCPQQQQQPPQQPYSRRNHHQHLQHCASVDGQRGDVTSDGGRGASGWVASPPTVAARLRSDAGGSSAGTGDAGCSSSQGGSGDGTSSRLPGCPTLEDTVLSELSAVGATTGRRPAALLERRSVFSGGAGRVAVECAPAASRLLGMLGDHGGVVEHM
ncbi:unnamed protein product [Ectocarpus sp. CCAP 1310/34]|nr:unnamed protein product [Ectocarpus sp. CCAP 1310/34]